MHMIYLIHWCLLQYNCFTNILPIIHVYYLYIFVLISCLVNIFQLILIFVCKSIILLYYKIFSLNLPVTFCNSKIESVGKAFITIISTLNGCCFFCCYQTLIMIGGKFIPFFKIIYIYM